MKIARESLAAIWDEIYAIGQIHWNETEAYRHGQGFNPDKARYLQYEKAGLYLLFTARDLGRLVGYAGIYIMPSMHTQQLIAMEDTYFLTPDARRGRNAIEFIKAIEAHLEHLGVVEIALTTKLSNPRAERILEYMKYQFVEKRWSKPLKETLNVRT